MMLNKIRIHGGNFDQDKDVAYAIIEFYSEGTEENQEYLSVTITEKMKGQEKNRECHCRLSEHGIRELKVAVDMLVHEIDQMQIYKNQTAKGY